MKTAVDYSEAFFKVYQQVNFERTGEMILRADDFSKWLVSGVEKFIQSAIDEERERNQMTRDLTRICVIIARLDVILSIPNGPVLKWSRADFEEILRRLQIGMEQKDPFFVPLPPADNGLIDQQWKMVEVRNYAPKLNNLPKEEIDHEPRILETEDN